MKTSYKAWAAIGASLLLAACGGGGGAGSASTSNNAPGRGQLVQSPPVRVTSLSSADYTTLLSANSTTQGLLQLSTGSLTGPLPCGVDIQYLQYGTVGAYGEATTASAALMVPTGSNPACTGPRPIVLHAHGTAVEHRYNLADFSDSTNPAYAEANVLASIYAANGYIVVAPNYAGYDSSNLGYHPFLVASQQSKDMLDALVAAKTALPTLIAGTTTNGKVYLSGYSQGGHVALATHSAMITDPASVATLASLNLVVRGSAPMSGPYAMLNYGDTIVGGGVPAGSTTLMPMLLTGYQKSYNNTMYSSASALYESTYATGIESLFPGALSYTNLVAEGKVPQLALFPASSSPGAIQGQPLTPLWDLGFGTPDLIKDSFRQTYLYDYTVNHASPQFPLRAKLLANDLTHNVPQPVGATMLCGGGNDPTVYYSVNTSALLATGGWPTGVTNHAVTEVNMDLNGGGVTSGADPFQTLKLSFTATNPTSAANYASTYHTNLVPYCVRAALGFFELVN